MAVHLSPVVIVQHQQEIRVFGFWFFFCCKFVGGINLKLLPALSFFSFLPSFSFFLGVPKRRRCSPKQPRFSHQLNSRSGCQKAKQKKQQKHKAKEVTHAFVPHGRRFPAGSLGAVCHRFNFPCRLPASTRVAPLTGCCSQFGCRDASYRISIRHEL